MTVSAVPNIPTLTASTPMSEATARTCSMIIAAGTCSTALTSTVFCAVSAVIAVIPWTPHLAKAFRSAWIPAPPPESEPAIESTAGIIAAQLRGEGARCGCRRRAPNR